MAEGQGLLANSLMGMYTRSLTLESDTKSGLILSAQGLDGHPVMVLNLNQK